MKRKKWPLFLLALGIGLGAASMSKAAVLAYEGFDYPNDGPQLNGRDGGFGWATAWDDGSAVDFNHLTQDDTSLDSAAFPFTPTGDRVAGTGGNIVRQFNDGILMGGEGNVLYASFLINKLQDGGTGGDNIEFNLGSTTTPTVLRIGIGSPDQFFVNFNGSTEDGELVEFGETYFVIAKLVSHAGTEPDEVYVSFFGEGDIVPGTEPADWDISLENSSGANIRVARMAFGANAIGAVDEIRIGQTWSDVTAVPEPATWALVAVGSFAALGLRRRMSR